MRINTYYLKKMQHWLLPYTCILCKNLSNTSQDLCSACLELLPSVIDHCPRCANPLPASSSLRGGLIAEAIHADYPNGLLQSQNGLAMTATLCLQCHQFPPPFDAAFALYLYKQPIIQLILELKFRQALINARILGEQMAKQIQQIWYAQNALPDVIIPMPLHSERIKERGFNQAIELARPIAKAIQRPIKYDAAIRIKPTLAQSSLNAIERRENIQNAFQLTEHLHQLHIAVVDDVITTGETMIEFCKTLRQSGARQIDVWCCARAHRSGIDRLPI